MPTASTKDLAQAARWFHALADETRLRIIDCLLECEQCVCDLTDALQTGQSRLSFHLKILKEAGILKDRREGRWIYYSLSEEALDQIGDLLESLKHKGHKRRQATCCE
jgi:ArsR family transcriptional regulator